jgi:glutaredoxin
VVVIVAGGTAYWLTKKSPTAHVTQGTVFFYGQECPHCQDVEKFLEDNKVADKVKYDSVEVWHNEDNAKMMIARAKECGMSEDQIGVPFVASDGKCYVGTPDVEAFFKQKAGIQ